jgi:hypothetical protein
MMRVLILIVMVRPPWQSRAPPLLQANLLPNLDKGKHTCLMAKESGRKVKSKTSPPKFVSSDDDIGSSDEEDEEVLLNVMSKNPTTRIKGLLSEVGLGDEILDQQEKFLIQEKERNQELKKLLKLEKEKNEKLDQELAQSNEIISSLKSSSGALQKTHMMFCKRLINILKCNLILFGKTPPSLQTVMNLPHVK